MSLIELLPNEKIIVGIRKHWLVFFVEMFGLMLAAVVPLVLAPFVDNVLGPEVVASVGGAVRLENVLVFLIGAWLLIVAMVLFVSLTSYYLDILIITNQRLIDIDQIWLFARDVATAPLQNIEDVKVEALGIFATLFKFGTLHIQTAAETKEVVIRGIRHPERAKDAVMRAYHEALGTMSRRP